MSGNPWHRADPKALARLEALLEDEFPDLHLVERHGQLALTGDYLIAQNGRVLDRYQIEVLIPQAGPTSDIPVVRETAARIPRTPDRHVYDDGTACLLVPDEFWYNHPNGMDLVQFLKGPVLSFFVGQSLVETGNPWPHGERPHGGRGVVEFYAPLVGTDKPDRIKAYLEVIAAKKLRHGWTCPCGSRRRIRECHFRLLQKLRQRIPRRVVQSSLRHL